MFAGRSPKRFPLIYAMVVVFLGGCAKKSISKSQLRGITAEIVAAAQKATQPKSDIAIRPELHPNDAGAGHPVADDVYVTLSNASQASGLKQALDAIARRHNLLISETNSDSVVRLDL